MTKCIDYTDLFLALRNRDREKYERYKFLEPPQLPDSLKARSRLYNDMLDFLATGYVPRTDEIVSIDGHGNVQ